MLRPIPDLPDNAVGFTAIGMVTAEDYERDIIPAVEALWAQHKKVRFLYHLGADFEKFEAGAMWDDAKLGLKHLTGWEKIAVVSDVNWIRNGVKILGFAMPGHVRVFHNRDLSEAISWIEEA